MQAWALCPHCVAPAIPCAARRGRLSAPRRAACRPRAASARATLGAMPLAAPLPPPPPPPPARMGMACFTRELSLSAQNPYSLALAAMAALVSFAAAWLLARRRSREALRKLQLDANVAQMSSPVAVLPSAEDPDGDDAGDNALWLNLSLFPSIWRLFRKNTATLIENTLQPILDNVKLPGYVRAIRIRNLSVGTRPPLVRKIRRLPSRARSELQYSFIGRLVGDMEVDLDVDLKLPFFKKRSLSCPVTLTDLDIEAKVWIGFTLMPGPPWLRRIQWSLLKLPTVKLQLRIGNIVPVTGLPVIASVLNHIFQRAIPQEFLFPKTEILDLDTETFTPPRAGGDGAAEPAEEAASGGQPPSGKDATLDNTILRKQYPALWALFDSMDDDDDGYLNPEEVVTGLSMDWGFSSTLDSDRRALFNLLDDDDDGLVSFKEFIAQWPGLRSVFVPRRFKGVVAGVLQKAKALPTPDFGFSDPYVVLSVESKSVTSRKNFQSSRRGKVAGDAVWNEGWELEVQEPDTASVTVQVREGSPFAIYMNTRSDRPLQAGMSAVASAMKSAASAIPREADVFHPGRLLGSGHVKVSKLKAGRPVKMWVPLEPGDGRVLVDLAYAQYVDPRPL